MEDRRVNKGAGPDGAESQAPGAPEGKIARRARQLAQLGKLQEEVNLLGRLLEKLGGKIDHKEAKGLEKAQEAFVELQGALWGLEKMISKKKGPGMKIELTDTSKDMVIKLSEGNPGAIRVLVEMLQVGSRVDPTAPWGVFTPLFQLDMMGIYGDGIWLLYKDICKEDIVNTLAVLRAAQLGHIGSGVVVETIQCHRIAQPQNSEIYPGELLK